MKFSHLWSFQTLQEEKIEFYYTLLNHLYTGESSSNENGKLFQIFENGSTTPLHLAAGGGHLEVCKFFVSIVKNKNPKDKYGTTPLHDAATGGYIAIYKLIGKRVKDRNPEDHVGNVPLKYAMDKKNYDLCKLINELTYSNKPKKPKNKKKKKRSKREQD